LDYATPRQIVEVCRQTYCGTIGVEFMHLMDPHEKSWIQQRIEEPRNHTDFTVNGKRAILERLTQAEGLEQYLHTKYVGTKRFGLDGGGSRRP
jgi:2-oxoglutarate dehydrogenase E1 component